MKQIRFIVLGISLLVAFSASVPGQTAELVSVNKTGTGSGNGTSDVSVVSANGRFVAFVSGASNLSPQDANGASWDVYVRDLLTDKTTLVSVNNAGVGGDSSSYQPAISADGRYVAFVSEATNLVPGDTLDTDVFVRDLRTGTTKILSVDSNGNLGGHYRSYNPVITPNGRFVAFVSQAPLVAIDKNSSSDVYVRDLVAGTIKLVSINSAGTAAGKNPSYTSDSLNPAITPDGHYIAFESFDIDLISSPRLNSFGTQIFVRNMVTNQTTLVSINRAGANGGNYFSSNARISTDGRYVIFNSLANNLVADDLNGSKEDVFVRDLVERTTALVSINYNGTASGNNESVGRTSVSNDGRFVAFTSAATDLVTDPVFITPNVYVRDIVAGKTQLVSVNHAGTGGGHGPSAKPMISAANGRFVVFESRAQDLVFNDTNSTRYCDVYVRDLLDGTTSLVSINRTGMGSGNGDSGSLSSQEMRTITSTISPDGKIIAFSSLANDLVTNDNNGRRKDVFAVNRSGGTLQFGDVSYSANESGGSIKATVRRTGGTLGAITVNFASSNSTAIAGQDYAASTGTLSFASGVRVKTITIPLINDAIDEADKSFKLTLSHPTGNVLLGAHTVASLSIVDDDLPPTLSIDNLSINEGNAETSNATFTVKLSSASSYPITVQYSTIDNTATTPGDYTAASGTLSFAPGQTSMTITVQIEGDTQQEDNETFEVNLADPTNATIVDGLAVGTILNDD